MKKQILGVLGAALAVLAVFRFIPDFIRYLKIERM